MSVQVRRRREAASFLASFVGAQGELLVDTTNNRVQVHDGATPGGWPAAKLADVVARTAVADANYTALPTDRTIAVTALTAARGISLPAAAAYPTATQLVVVDESGACSATNAITLARAGTDTINGGASAVIALAYGFLALVSDGVSKWTIIDQSTTALAQLAPTAVTINRNAAINGSFAINQRGYASGATLAAGAYAHDRWKAGSGGCAYTFTQAVPDTAITITTGTLVQVIEAANVYATSYWLSWTGTAQARVWQGTAGGAYAASPILVSGLTIGTAASLEVATGTLGLVQFEPALANAGPTRFERRQLGQELAFCQRYYQVLGPLAYQASAAGNVSYTLNLARTMRASPTLSMVGTPTYSNGSNVVMYSLGPAAVQFGFTCSASSGYVTGLNIACATEL